MFDADDLAWPAFEICPLDEEVTASVPEYEEACVIVWKHDRKQFCLRPWQIKQIDFREMLTTVIEW